MWTWFTSWFQETPEKDPEQFEMFEMIEKEKGEPCDCQCANAKSLPVWVKEQYLSKTKEPKEIVQCSIPSWAENEYQWSKENENMLLHYEFQNMNKRYSKYFHPISSSDTHPNICSSDPSFVTFVPLLLTGVETPIIKKVNYSISPSPLIYDEIDHLLFNAMMIEKENEILRLIHE